MHFEFESAVQGYQYYCKFWSPTKNEVLKCFHERGNPFDIFAIKTWLNGNPEADSYLPCEISQLTKFIFGRGTEVEDKLSSKHYQRSNLTPGTLEIPCMVRVAMPGT